MNSVNGGKWGFHREGHMTIVPEGDTAPRGNSSKDPEAGWDGGTGLCGGEKTGKTIE
ncbi:hypothetical protein JW905_06885 [bacterium]|nr:hypothetical protein [candidate division CSSED10-310 bacterium]